MGPTRRRRRADVTTTELVGGVERLAVGLQEHVEDRALYEATKRSLLDQRWEDMNAYAHAKTDVVVAIRERARAARGA